MRKKPQKQAAGAEQRKKRLAVIISICLSAAVVVAAIAGTIAYTLTNQLPQNEKQLSTNAREVLLQTFHDVSSGEKQALRRTIDSENPLNLVSYCGDQPLLTLWAAIPENQKQHTVLLLIPGHGLLPGGDQSLAWLEETADACEQNQIPYAIQAIDGEYHMEERFPVAYLEGRFARSPYFYGLSAAGLYAGISLRGEVESNNVPYLIDCIELAAKYGAFFIWNEAGFEEGGSLVLQWLEKNEALYTAFQENAANIILMARQASFSLTACSVMQGLWLAGLVGNWGICADWSAWQTGGGRETLFGEYDRYVDSEEEKRFSYPENLYVQSMMLAMSCGGTCFQADTTAFATASGGKVVAGFQYGIAPLFDAIRNGEVEIPSREDVLRETPAAVLGSANAPDFYESQSKDSLYPSTGRYRILPLLPSNLREHERARFAQNGILLIDEKKEQSDYDALFSEQAQGSAYTVRTGTQWFFIHPLGNTKLEASAVGTPVYSNASAFSISAQEHTSAIISEKEDRLSFYLSNYRTDKGELLKAVTQEQLEQESIVQICKTYMTLDENGDPVGLDDSQLRETTITVTGTYNGGAPRLILRSDMEGGAQTRPFTHTTQWDPASQTFTVTIRHNGVVKLDILLDQAQGEAVQAKREPTQIEEPANASVSTQALQKTINSCTTAEGALYIDYSYLTFQNALANARLILSEGAASQQEVDRAQEALENAYRGLIPIGEYVALLNEVASMELTGYTQEAVDKLWLCFDALLRETLSNQVYVAGRSNELHYKAIYREKRFDKAAKQQALEEKYAALRQARNDLQGTKIFS